ncbi:MAG: hypothetical protein GX591_04435 [Planctomycetes bacterium]|nr:hypothetical protein [Planctomycetota bacterium]
MRWLPFGILAAVVLALQLSVAAALRIPVGDGGLVLAIDLPAVLAVLIALRTRNATDAALAGWVLGLGIDLAVTGVPLGLHALTFAMAAGLICQIRPAVFTDSLLTQALLVGGFCLIGHGLARLFVNLYVRPDAAHLGGDLLQVLLVALGSALAGPFILAVGKRTDWLIMDQPSWRR